MKKPGVVGRSFQDDSFQVGKMSKPIGDDGLHLTIGCTYVAKLITCHYEQL
jgi:hypothetical protein